MAKKTDGNIADTRPKVYVEPERVTALPQYDDPITTEGCSYTAVSLVPVKPGIYIVIEIDLDKDDNVLKVTKSPPTPFYIAQRQQRRRCAYLFTRSEFEKMRT